MSLEGAMDYSTIFRSAWEITRRCRALWLFGILLALTTASWTPWMLGNASRDEEGDFSLVTYNAHDDSVEIPWLVRARGSGEGDIIFNYKGRQDGRPLTKGDVIINYSPPDEFSLAVASEGPGGFLDLSTVRMASDVVRNIVLIVVGLFFVLGLLLIAGIVAHYVAQTALIQSVDAYEKTGRRPGVRGGFRQGWSRTAVKLFLIDLFVNVLALAFILLLFLVALAPLSLWATGNIAAGVIGSLLTVGLFLVNVVLVIVAAASLSLLKHFVRRACAIDGLGMIEAIRHGTVVVRHHVRQVAPVWLVFIAVSVVWPIFMIPLAILLMIGGLVLGGATGVLAGALAFTVFEGVAPWIIGAAVGIPVFLLVLVGPLAFLGGLRMVFESSTWTLTYRELRAKERPVLTSPPELGVATVL
jgi:hypothetical protein